MYVGYSAGAMVAAPTLEPLRTTSPFAPPPALDLTGLALADVLVSTTSAPAARSDMRRRRKRSRGGCGWSRCATARS